MAAWDPEAFENGVIADMRANGGRVTSGPLAGHPLLVMTSRGARTGEPRRSILTWSRDGEDYIVAGTASGSPKTPGWIYNVTTNPEVDLEVDGRRITATAQVVDESARERLWQHHVERLPWFADYPKQSGRVIPVVRLTPQETSAPKD